MAALPLHHPLHTDGVREARSVVPDALRCTVGGGSAVLVIEKQNWQPVIDAIWENRGVEDYDARSSAVKTDFMRKWHHDRSGSSLSLDEITEEEVFDAAGSRGELEQDVLSQMQINAFVEGCISERDREILRLRMEGYTEQEITDRVGYQTASAYEDFVTAEYAKYLNQ